ncbi:glycosyltransferase 87 family protein [Acidobacteria bacterium AH-259-O06]|nr:glycosyltransferase 87 family protein [Acidobacteria bacterium AH-259-O06]
MVSYFHAQRYHLLLFGAGLGLFARFVLSALSEGSDDIRYWQQFAESISQHGLYQLYVTNPLFNHPPLMGYLAAGSLWLSQWLDAPFSFFFKFPVIVAEVLSAVIVGSIWARRRGKMGGALAMFLYAWAIGPILFSGFHGNTDSLCAFLALLAVFLIEEKRRHFAGGLALAAAINVKLIPLLLLLPLISSYRSGPDLRRFVGGLSFFVLPLIPPLMYGGQSFYQNVFNYTSHINYWGVQWFLLVAMDLFWLGHFPRVAFLLHNMTIWYGNYGRVLVLCLILALSIYAYLISRYNRYELAAISLAVFLVFAPGFGIQYLAIIAPFLFSLSLRLGTIYSVLVGLFSGLVYYHFLIQWMPLATLHNSRFPPSAWLPSFMTWCFLALFLTARCVRKTARTFTS